MSLIYKEKSLDFYRPRADQKLFFFLTSDLGEQKSIENHPWFKEGSIWIQSETEQPEVLIPAPMGMDEDLGLGEGEPEEGDSIEDTLDEGQPVVNDEPITNDDVDEAIDEELEAVTSTQKAILYLSNKGIDMTGVGKSKSEVLAVAGDNNIVFPNWL